MGYILILLAAVCWGLIGPVAKLAFREGVEPLEVAFWRAALGGVLFGAHAAWRRSGRVAREHLGVLVAFGLVGVTLFYGAYQLAVEQGGAALASVLLYTAPAWVAGMGVLWLGERLTGAKLAALGMTVLGVVGVALGGSAEVRPSVSAVGWGLVSGLAYALYYLFGKRYFERYDPALLYAYALPVGAVGLLPWVSFSAKTPVAWGALLGLVVVSTYLAYLLYAEGLKRVEATRASIVATLEPVVAAALAYAWWGERFGPLQYVGAGLILAAVVVAVRGERTAPRPERGAR